VDIKATIKHLLNCFCVWQTVAEDEGDLLVGGHVMRMENTCDDVRGRYSWMTSRRGDPEKRTDHWTCFRW